MSKYGELTLTFNYGTKDEDRYYDDDDFVEVSTKVQPEDTEEWNSLSSYEMAETIIAGGKKLMAEAGYSNTKVQSLYNLDWQEVKYHAPSDYYHNKYLLVVYYDTSQKNFVTTSDVWNALSKKFEYHGESATYWAEFPEPPIQT